MNDTTTAQTGIYRAMAGVMRDITAIGKNSKNQAQGFKFRGIDAVYNELHDLLAKHGIVTLPQAGTPVTEERTNKNGTILRFVQLPMTYKFVAEDGSQVFCHVIGEGMDSGDKATNKAMAIAHKYALLQTFLIPTEETKDPDSETHEVTPKAAVAIGKPNIPDWAVSNKLFDAMDKNKLTEADIIAFCKHKGMKAPEYVSDLSDKIKARLLEILPEIIQFSLNK